MLGWGHHPRAPPGVGQTPGWFLGASREGWSIPGSRCLCWVHTTCVLLCSKTCLGEGCWSTPSEELAISCVLWTGVRDARVTQWWQICLLQGLVLGPSMNPVLTTAFPPPQLRRSPIKKVRKSLALDIVDEDVKLVMSTVPKGLAVVRVGHILEHRGLWEVGLVGLISTALWVIAWKPLTRDPSQAGVPAPCMQT